jgi:hypothetical protein
MNEKIDKLLATLKIEYSFFWIGSLSLIPLYESNIIQEGIYTDDVKIKYILYTVGILLSVILIPLALKLFSVSLVNRIRNLSIDDAMKSYRKWSEIRLGLLFIPAILNISFYYMTMDTTGILCASMALIASLFCVPDKKKILNELDIEQ